MKKGKLIIAATFLLLSTFLYACDGLTVRKATIDLEPSRPLCVAATLQTGDFQIFFHLIEEVANKNDLKCAPYKESEKYFGCSIDTLYLTTYVRENRGVQVKISEFGPLSKTKRFEKLEKDINEMFAREFPGRDLILIQKE